MRVREVNLRCGKLAKCIDIHVSGNKDGDYIIIIIMILITI